MATETDTTRALGELPDVGPSVAPVIWVPAGALVAVALIITVVLSVPIVLIVPLAVLPAVGWWLRVRSALRSAPEAAVASVSPDAPSEVNPRLDNIVDGLVLTMGVARPDIVIIDERCLVGAVLAGNTSRGTLVITRGLVEALGRIELEALVAVLLDRLRTGYSRNLMAAEALAELPRLPLVSGLVRRARDTLLPGGIDVSIDRDAVRVTRFPPALADVLALIAADDVTCAHRGLLALRAHWLAAPLAHDASSPHRLPSIALRETPLADRIDIVKEA